MGDNSTSYPKCSELALEKIKQDNLNEIVEDRYKRLETYTKIIVGAIYVSAFALWKQECRILSNLEMATTGLLLTISIATFALWEIFRVFFSYRTFLKLHAAADSPLEQFQELYDSAKAAVKRDERRIMPFWYVVLAFTIIPAFSAAGILTWSFIRNILSALYKC